MKRFAPVIALLLVFALSACGGGSKSAGPLGLVRSTSSATKSASEAAKSSQATSDCAEINGNAVPNTNREEHTEDGSHRNDRFPEPEGSDRNSRPSDAEGSDCDSRSSDAEGSGGSSDRDTHSSNAGPAYLDASTGADTHPSDADHCRAATFGVLSARLLPPLARTPVTALTLPPTARRSSSMTRTTQVTSMDSMAATTTAPIGISVA